MSNIGGRFTVPKLEEVLDRKGRVLARYLPDFDYRITVRNHEMVAEMIADGKAQLGRRSPAAAKSGPRDLKSDRGRPRGKITVSKTTKKRRKV